MFQFYLSSIKRIWKPIGKQKENRFNSTLVQLKDVSHAYEPYPFLSFNSTLVQLKDVTLSNIK